MSTLKVVALSVIQAYVGNSFVSWETTTPLADGTWKLTLGGKPSELKFDTARMRGTFRFQNRLFKFRYNDKGEITDGYK